MARAIDASELMAEIQACSWDSEQDKERAEDLVLGMPTLTPPNEALTIEQLREMVGEPVWVQTPGIPQYGRWVIVAGVDTEYWQSTLYCQGDYTCQNYGRDWLAYRRPPEGEADGGK